MRFRVTWLMFVLTVTSSPGLHAQSDESDWIAEAAVVLGEIDIGRAATARAGDLTLPQWIEAFTTHAPVTVRVR